MRYCLCVITNELQSKSLYHDGFNIRSVKRLSDSEVFTVGDFVKETITGQCKGWEIKEFSLKDSRCFSCGVNINNIEKLKEVLFTTEDGVDIFEGDTYYVANIKSWQCYKHYANIDGNTGLDKYFSTKEAAEEYILMNKPCLSINNVLHCIPKLSPRLLSIIKGYVNLKKI